VIRFRRQAPGDEVGSKKAPRKSSLEGTSGPPSPTPHDPATPVTVEGYVRPAPKEVAGLVRAHHEDSEPPTAPPAEPIFSTEGLLAGRRPRRRRRTLLLAAFGGVLSLVVLASLAGNAAGPLPPVSATDGPSVSPGGGIAGDPSETVMGASTAPGAASSASSDGEPSAEPSPGGHHSPALTPSGSPGPTPTGSGGPSPSATASSSPGPSATPSPTVPWPTPTLTPWPTPTLTPWPTPTLTPVPTPTPSPTPTPTPVVPVSIGPSGSITVTHKVTFTLYVYTLPGAACTLTASTATNPIFATRDLGTAPGATPSFTVVWGGPPPISPWWAINDYTVTATCTLSGYSAGHATKAIQVVKE